MRFTIIPHPRQLCLPPSSSHFIFVPNTTPCSYGLSSFKTHLAWCSSHSLPHRNVTSITLRQWWFSRLYPSWRWYSIQRPRRNARLSWPEWPKIVYSSKTVTYLRNNRAVWWLGIEHATASCEWDVLTTRPTSDQVVNVDTSVESIHAAFTISALSPLYATRRKKLPVPPGCHFDSDVYVSI